MIAHQTVGNHPHSHEALEIAHDFPKDLFILPFKDLPAVHDPRDAMIK
jgi:hypothetical protein